MDTLTYVPAGPSTFGEDPKSNNSEETVVEALQQPQTPRYPNQNGFLTNF